MKTVNALGSSLLILSFTAAALPLAQAEPPAAFQADQFVDSVGVAVHLNYPTYSNYTSLKPLLTGLGVRHIRDGVYNSSVDSEFVDLSSNNNIRATLVLDQRDGNGVLAPSGIAGQLSFLQNTTYSQYGNASLLSAVETIEGPNEYDINHGSNDTNWAAILLSYQQTLFSDINGNSAFSTVSVLAPSMGQTNDLSSLSSSFASAADLGNAHPYPGTANPGYPGNIATYLRDSQNIWPALPLQVSEDGYSTMNSDASQCVSEATQAQYIPRLVLENFRRGVQRTFLYDLVDEDTATNTSNYSHHFGLLRSDLSLKPAYTSLKNLLSLLADPGATFTPSYLAYGLGGTTADVHELLLAKRNGVNYLVLWVESSAAASQTVTVSFNEPVSSVVQYSPDSSTTGTTVSLPASSINSPSAINVNVGSDPIVLKITRAAGMASGSVVTDSLTDLSKTVAASNWETTTPTSPLTAADWLGDGTLAHRTSDTASDYLTYANVSINSFSAKLGLRYNTTNPDDVLNFNFASVVFSASPDGASNWTTVPTFLGPIDKTETGLAQASAGWFVTVSPSGTLPAGTNYLKLSINSTTGSSDKPSLFQMVIDQSGIEEAETYLPTAILSGTTATATNDTNASGGQLVVLNATGSGQYIEFTVPNIPAGDYSLGYRFLKGPNRGVAQLSFDGTNVGGTADDYEATTPYVTSMRGNITVSTAGSHKVRFTVTGKNANSSGYTLGIDRMIFQAQ